MELSEEETHVFLTHDWGPGEVNHKRVSKINRALKILGYKTWFDEEGKAQVAWDKAKEQGDGKVTFKDQEVEGKVVEGWYTLSLKTLIKNNRLLS